MKTKYKRIFILLFILAAVFISALVVYSQNLIYIAVFQFCENNVKLEKSSIPVVWCSLSDVISEPNFVFDQSLMLINDEYKIPDDISWNVCEYKDSGVFMNECIMAAYSDLSAAVLDKTGKKLLVKSHFRTEDEQATIYKNSPSYAAEPGSSEHETGLSLDVYIQHNAGYNFIKTDGGKYVNTNCHEYGFIIRYPFYGKSSTKIRYEPWHIRYVGEIHAKIIYANGLTLEEYILSLEPNVVYSVDNCYIVRSECLEGSILIPLGCSEYVVSPDNTGYYIIAAYK